MFLQKSCCSLRGIPSKNIALAVVFTGALFLFSCSEGGGSPVANTDEASSASGASNAIPEDNLTGGSGGAAPIGPLLEELVMMSRNDKRACVLKSNRVFCLRVSSSRLPAAIEAREVTMPPQPASTTKAASTITAISANGSQHGCVIRDGRVICWGKGFYDDFKAENPSDPVDSRWEGRYVKNLPRGVSGVSIGPRSACAILDEEAMCWGNNVHGQLGNGRKEAGFYSVSSTGLSSGVRAIDIGSTSACAIIDGAAKCWGINSYGMLGSATAGSSSYTPTQVQGLESGVKAISLGGNHACALVKKSGELNTGVMCWGRNDYGQLGNGNTASPSLPVSVSMPGANPQVEAVSAGYYHSCAVVEGRAMCWGRNNHGQLGDGNTPSPSLPVSVSMPGANPQVEAVSASHYHSCALVENGDVFCWGKYGRKRSGTFPDQFQDSVGPTSVTLPPASS